MSEICKLCGEEVAPDNIKRLTELQCDELGYGSGTVIHKCCPYADQKPVSDDEPAAQALWRIANAHCADFEYKLPEDYELYRSDSDADIIWDAQNGLIAHCVDSDSDCVKIFRLEADDIEEKR